VEMHLFGHLVPIEVARRRLLAAVRPVRRSEAVPTETAFGRVPVRSVRAPAPVPAFARAMWDGYAVRSVDTKGATPRRPARLTLVGEVFAEQQFRRPLGPNETVAIATGGALPRGADGIAIFEDSTVHGKELEVPGPVGRGDRVSPPGDDFPRGALLARAGQPLSAVDLGSLAASGIARIRVRARPVVAVLPNGNELLPLGAPRASGRVFESNNATLAPVVAATGAVPELGRPLPDDPRAIEAALRSALRRSDLVLTTGGSSVGERDLLPGILHRMGRPLFHGIAVRPGKPTIAARVGRKIIVGLPGHPTSCLLNMYWLVLPALRRLAGLPGPGWTERSRVLAQDASRPSPELTTVVPLAIRGGQAYPTFRGSSALSSLRGATAFALVPPGRKGARAGDRLRTYELDPPLGVPEPSVANR
jgi:molybdopterin molybdotransferase